MAILTKKTPKKAKKAGTVNQTGVAYRVLLKPRITEKAYTEGAKGKYVFHVASTATKLSVKRAVQEVYGVEAVAVNIVNLPGKTKAFGRSQTPGKQKSVKKAYVTLPEGQTLELFKAGL
jgi:large subunit ribosomal protein L23